MPKEKLTKETVKKALKLVSNGASNQDVINYLGCAENTFYGWLRNPKTENQMQLSQGLKRVEVERKMWHLQQIQKAAESGKWQASAWYLERKYFQEFGQAQRVVIDTTAEETDKSIKELIGALGLE